VVPVLTTICHSSEKPKYRPLTAHPTIESAAMEKTAELPVHLDILDAKTANDFSNSAITMISSIDDYQRV
jgi:hypothetical protein